MPSEAPPEVKVEAKIDFTFRGEQKLDLGFGVRGGQRQAESMSWEALRKAGS